MGNGLSYTTTEDQFLIDNCINGDMNYGEAAKKLGRPSAKTIGARIARLKEIHNFKKNTLQKNPELKVEAEMQTESGSELIAMEKENTCAAEEVTIRDQDYLKKKFDELLVEIATQPQPLPDLDELESIPYTTVPMNSSFGQAVHIASVLADLFGDEVGYFSFFKNSGGLTIDIGDKRISVHEIADDAEI